MSKYFGTDGIRGVWGERLNEALCYKVGFALSQYFFKGEVIIGRDTRISCREIERALQSGLKDGGMTVRFVGIVPTPAVAYLTKKHGAKCGIMITASHNPATHNGIKLFDESGMKLNEEQEGSIEYYIDNSTMQNAECRMQSDGGNDLTKKNEYIDYIVQAADTSLKDFHVFLDCGYGAAGTVAREIFERLGAKVSIENHSLRGEKINAGCGALYPEYVMRTMQDNSIENCDENKLKRIGFAFDGDGDRLSVVYDGKIIDGDSVLYNLARAMELEGNVVVGTVLSNLALERELEKEGKRLIRVPVGDKYICDLLHKKNYSLGGEQSGHYILGNYLPTGDGVLAAVFFLKSILKCKKPRFLELVPQKAISLPAEKGILFESKTLSLIQKWEEELSGKGRLIVRMSGTEAKIRVMVECENEDLVTNALGEFKEHITAKKTNDFH